MPEVVVVVVEATGDLGLPVAAAMIDTQVVMVAIVEEVFAVEMAEDTVMEINMTRKVIIEEEMK